MGNLRDGAKKPVTEEEIKRLRAKKRKQEQKRRAKRRRRAVFVVFVLLVVGVIFGLTRCNSGSGKKWKKQAEETTITLMADGSVVFEEVVKDAQYDKKELEEFAKAQIEAYSVPEGKYVKLAKVDVNDEGAYLRTEFSDVAVYSGFSGYDAFYGKLSAAKSKYEFASVFEEVTETEGSDGEVKVQTKEVNRDTVMNRGDDDVFVLQENVRVETEREIAYISMEGTKIDAQGVVVSPTDGNKDAAPICYIVFKSNDEGEK